VGASAISCLKSLTIISKLLRAKSSDALSSKLDLASLRSVAVRAKYVITRPVRSTTKASMMTNAAPLRSEDKEDRDFTYFEMRN